MPVSFSKSLVRKHLVALRHENDSQARDLVGRPVLDAPSLEGHAPIGDPRVVDAEEAGDRPQGGGFAGAVGAENGDDLSRFDGEADPLYRGDGAVIDDFQLVDAQQCGLTHRRAPATGRYLNGHNRK
jgi:hypothetical protein